MNIEQIIRSWKADEEDQTTSPAANPVGEELTDQQLQEVGGGCTLDSCEASCYVDTGHCRYASLGI